jgi:hypothetical protein
MSDNPFAAPVTVDTVPIPPSAALQSTVFENPGGHDDASLGEREYVAEVSSIWTRTEGNRNNYLVTIIYILAAFISLTAVGIAIGSRLMISIGVTIGMLSAVFIYYTRMEFKLIVAIPVLKISRLLRAHFPDFLPAIVSFISALCAAYLLAFFNMWFIDPASASVPGVRYAAACALAWLCPHLAVIGCRRCARTSAHQPV